MAIGKWISFAQPGSPPANTPVPNPVSIPCTADGKQFGLENFGNTCYANSVLQALYFCSPFRDLVIQHADLYVSTQNAMSLQFSPTHPSSPTAARRKPDRNPTQDASPPNVAPHPPTPSLPSTTRALFSALRALYFHISQNPADKGTVAPRAFIQKLRELNEAFRNTMHQDAHEFLNYLLNRIVEEIEQEKKLRLASGDDLPHSVKSSSTTSHLPAMTASASSSSTPSPGATFIHQIFEGTLTSETRCLTCENVSSRDESFLDLSIDIEQNSSVTACLKQFSASEMLCQKDKFFCDACCDLQEAERRMKIKRLPNVLALHLKRFKYQEDIKKYTKLTYRVAFPFELRLFNTVDDIPNPDRLYELFAIVVHIGNGPNHGHYVSIIKTRGTWLVFDDDTVDSIKESDIPKYFGDSNSGSAYVLFYQALDIDLLGLGLRMPTPEPVAVPLSEPPQNRQPTDSPVSTAQSIPSLPPGLTEDSSSPTPVPESDLQFPRPVSPPRIATPPELPKPPRKVPSSLLKSLVGNGPPRNDASVLRQSRSVLDEKLGLAAAKSNTSSTAVFPREDPKPLESNDNGGFAANGKEGQSDRTMMGWFRRRSFKSIRVRPISDANTDVPPLPHDALTAPGGSPVRNQSTRSSSNSSKDSRHPLDSPTPGRSSPLTSTSPLPNGKPTPLSRSLDALSPEMDPKQTLTSPTSYSSPTSPSPDGYLRPRPLPSIPASPSTPKVEAPPQPPFPRKSLEHGRTKRRPALPTMKDLPQPSLSVKLSGRPSTSTGTPATTVDYPPLPSALPSYHGHQRHNSTLRVPAANIATGRLDVHGDGAGRPKSAHATYGPVLSPPVAPVPPVPVPVSANATESQKRATRKLSLTAPMLGFGRRDKEKR